MLLRHPCMQANLRTIIWDFFFGNYCYFICFLGPYLEVSFFIKHSPEQLCVFLYLYFFPLRILLFHIINLMIFQSVAFLFLNFYLVSVKFFPCIWYRKFIKRRYRNVKILIRWIDNQFHLLFLANLSNATQKKIDSEENKIKVNSRESLVILIFKLFFFGKKNCDIQLYLKISLNHC